MIERCVLLILLALPLTGCASFGAVRSAEVHPGPSALLQASFTAGSADADRFAQLDCGTRCSLLGGEVGLALGWRPGGNSGSAVAIGGGINSTSSFVDGYVQLRSSGNPFGVGGRIGWGQWSSEGDDLREYSVHGRYDLKLHSGGRVALNPGLLLWRGDSVGSGNNTTRLTAAVLGAGLLRTRQNTTLTPGASLVVGRARLGSEDPFLVTLFTLSMSVTFHAER